MTDPSRRLEELRAALDALSARLLTATDEEPALARVHPAHRESAENLVQYVALRRDDIRTLQVDLARLGLSSLGRAEAQVAANVGAVSRAVDALAALPRDELTADGPLDLDEGAALLDANANALLGRPNGRRRTRIMVTLPSEAADDADLVDRIVHAGAELVRINCAHDGPGQWAAMVANVRRSAAVHGRPVRITMDLGGPKLRTGPIALAPGVVRVRPERDDLGRVVRPALVWLSAAPVPPPPDTVRIPVDDRSWLARRSIGDLVHFKDARGSRRTLRVTSSREHGLLAELRDTAYLLAATELEAGPGDTARVGELPAREQRLQLRRGDELHLVDDLAPADPAGPVPRIGCSLPEVFEDTRVGHRVFFDDGRIGGVVVEATPHALHIRVTDTPPRGARLAAAKGINLPDTTLGLPALSAEDIDCLPFVVRHADAVSLSFVRSAEDVLLLQEQLAALGGPGLGLILKVETVGGFERLPEILLAAMRSPHVGVMIARGDLAVEAGYARLAEVQEEILWLCEAAHVPVIWATEVLDHLARTGRPSRAEVTDAAMSGRAECVMLNKGPFVDHAVAFLDDILSRMADHQRKKSPLLRRLRAWDCLTQPTADGASAAVARTVTAPSR